MGDLFDGYAGTARLRRRSPDAWDEMFARGAGGLRGAIGGGPVGRGPVGDRDVRPVYGEVHAALARMTQEELRGRTGALADSYLAQGVTFDFAGEERPFPIDPVPRVVGQQEWAGIESGVVQRVRALEAFLADVYGPQEAVRDGVVPAQVISSSPEFHREVAGIDPVGGVRVHVAGIDLIRDELGVWRVLEDNVRVPSGVSYVISNRRVMAQTLPELFQSMRIRPVGEYPNRLLRALRKTAPPGVDEPTVVVLTPGVFNSAYYEHTLLARLMGVELVEGRDLFCAGGRVFMHTTKGPERVDVIYRRVDDEFLDPLVFRADSVLGSPGILLAARLGTVTIANAVGNGIADDKLVYTYLPALIRYYLGEEPLLPNVDTWRLEDPDSLAEVLDRLDELVVKPVNGSGGAGLCIGPQASRAELDALRRTLVADPRGWIAQPVVQLSTIPTLCDGGLRPRHADLRPFAVHDGDDVWVLPGGLTRVALPEGQLVVNSSQGGGSKDTWVLGGPSSSPSPDGQVALPLGAPELVGVQAAPVDVDVDAIGPPGRGHQQQQQQQSRARRALPEPHPEGAPPC
ncbi:circularly permuted type 2 ATP-grasp protein [Curtobacterium sp. Leaf261]|uniref:circularly permuted type 2 ATP-grasp protein n=1 Tax=Curtobacterium sp. Leaf261 TaxID=1736311 RepID=UPI0006FDAFB2|nr:circularly permuted type 2 ATP-grasp protein [Curtobacterium sp. Leaf261]KQO60298.1 hypothetical protein ASF23_13790 [Curtobacterium sp. Leaf261]